MITLLMPETSLRPIIVMCFLFFCPGMVLVRFFRLNDPLAEWVVAVALSLSLDAIITAIFLYAGRWSPSAILTALLLFTLICSSIQFVLLHPTIAQRVNCAYLQENEALADIETVVLRSIIHPTSDKSTYTTTMRSSSHSTTLGSRSLRKTRLLAVNEPAGQEHMKSGNARSNAPYIPAEMR